MCVVVGSLTTAIDVINCLVTIVMTTGTLRAHDTCFLPKKWWSSRLAQRSVWNQCCSQIFLASQFLLEDFQSDVTVKPEMLEFKYEICTSYIFLFSPLSK